MEKNYYFAASEFQASIMSNAGSGAFGSYTQSGFTSTLCRLSETVASAWRSFNKAIMTPVKWLSAYYSECLEREMSTSQTLHLLNAQAAFIMNVFPVECPWLLRIAFGAWLAIAIKGCYDALK